MLNKPLKDVFIAIPTGSFVVAALIPKLIKWSSQGAEVCVVVSMPLVDLARNTCVKQFLKSKKKHLLFIDSDTVPDVGGPQRLLKTKKDVVAGVYNLLMSRKDGVAVTKPSCFSLILPGGNLAEAIPITPDAGIVRVAMAATGFLMIRRSVFEKIPQPWFEYRWLDVEHSVFNGEDVDFCYKLEKHKIAIWCDTGAKALHYKSLFI